jgi:hypothetical protein
MLSSGNAQIRTEAEWTETRTTLLLYRILGATPETVTPPPKSHQMTEELLRQPVIEIPLFNFFFLFLHLHFSLHHLHHHI